MKVYFFIPNQAIMPIYAPNKETTKKAFGRVIISVSVPMKGGPPKNPINPIDPTIVKAIDGMNFSDFPAFEYTIGITEDTPKPIIINPSVTNIKVGNKADIKNPVVIRMLLRSNVKRSPNLSINLSDINLPEAMHPMNTA